jgi:hypothetical protein
MDQGRRQQDGDGGADGGRLEHCGSFSLGCYGRDKIEAVSTGGNAFTTIGKWRRQGVASEG